MFFSVPNSLLRTKCDSPLQIFPRSRSPHHPETNFAEHLRDWQRQQSENLDLDTEPNRLDNVFKFFSELFGPCAASFYRSDKSAENKLGSSEFSRVAE